MFFCFGSYNHEHLTSINPWSNLHHSNVSQLRCKFLYHSPTDFLVGNLATAEHQGYLGLVTLLQKTAYMLDLEIKVMVISLRPYLDLFDLDLNLLLFRFLLFFALLVLKFAVIHDPADWRCGSRRHFNQIQLARLCGLQSLAQGQDTQLFTIVCNNTNFGSTNSVINIDSRSFCRGSYGSTS